MNEPADRAGNDPADRAMNDPANRVRSVRRGTV